MTTMTDAPVRPTVTPPARLGEELPVFCEQCGYSLHGMPQTRCGHCTVLQFHCPECGHHQPINTLRPAAQRIIGRLRGLWLAWVIFFKLNYFGWLLLAWFAMGVEWAYTWDYYNMRQGIMMRAPASLTFEIIAAFSLFAFGFGLVSRMFLLRWRRGLWIGLALSALVVPAVVLGIWIQSYFNHQRVTGLPPTQELVWVVILSLTAGMITLGAMAAWPVWVGLAKVFLPPRMSGPLLDWQRSMSDPAPTQRPEASMGRA